MSRTPKRAWIIGIDEVGRGPFAGPVTVCAVAIPTMQYHKMKWGVLTDSKKMTPRTRKQWYTKAKEYANEGVLRYAIASQTARAIDTKGLAVCIRLCIAKVLATLTIAPHECVLVLDGGLKAPVVYDRQKTIIKGDLSEKVISLASVIAKVHRDEYMETLHKKHPQYGWLTNKGYGTAAHRKAIKTHGISPFHRISFLSGTIDKKTKKC